MALLEVKNLNFSYKPIGPTGESDTTHASMVQSSTVQSSTVQSSTVRSSPLHSSTFQSSTLILNDVSFKVDKGELVAIQGPSGSGKSTLLALLAGFLKVQTGSIDFNGEPFSTFDDEQMSYYRNQKIGFIFQQFHLLPKLNVLENILLPANYSPDRTQTDPPGRKPVDLPAKALDLARYLEIDHRLQHHPNQLSGGQQQRVAIARALLHDPELILADEPTGNLDSKSAQNIIERLLDLNRQGKTIVIITHSDEIAQQCRRVIQIKDGKITKDQTQGNLLEETPIVAKLTQLFSGPSTGLTTEAIAKTTHTISSRPAQRFVPEMASFLSRAVLKEAWRDLSNNSLRSFLTMIGIIVGVASILAMITLGNFIKDKVLESYADMGINTVLFIGNPNWNMKAKDSSGVTFKSFQWEKDILPLFEIFPEIEKITPIMYGGRSTLSFAGKTIESEGRPVGVNESAFQITGRKLREGRTFSPFHIEQKNAVCIIGSEVAEKLFNEVPALDQILNIQGNQSSFGCKVIAVLEPLSSNKGWGNPNLEVYVPYTLYQSLAENIWDAQIDRVLIQLRAGSDIPEVGKVIQGYFTSRYGKSGRFRVHNDSVLIAQLQKFLSIFTIALGAIAMICLLVGGVGITNMMLASIAERFREIGLRKALGATHSRIRKHILMESVLLCGVAGIFGLIIGFSFYELVIFVTAKFVTSISFQWRFDSSAFLISFGSIAAVGILSGLAPALKAERLQILEALRSD
jgi:macrolide transport system ATP-binding/permease protein